MTHLIVNLMSLKKDPLNVFMLLFVCYPIFEFYVGNINQISRNVVCQQYHDVIILSYYSIYLFINLWKPIHSGAT